MTNHIIEFSSLLLLFALIYHFILRSSRQYGFLRKYCFLSIGLSAIIPLLPSLQSPKVIYLSHLPEAIITEAGTSTSPTSLSQHLSLDLVFITYLLITVILLIRFLFGLIKLHLIMADSLPTKINGYEVLQSTQISEPSSFYNSILLPISKNYDEGTMDTILRHEALHIKYGHTVEKLFMEVLKAIFWFHPAVWYLRSELQLIHEYQVDDQLGTSSDINKYKSILISLATNSNHLQLANPFASHLKKRINMMNNITKFKTRNYFFLAIFLLGGSFFIHGCQKEAETKKTFTKAEHKETTTDNTVQQRNNPNLDTIVVWDPDTMVETMTIIHKRPDQVALYPGCEGVTDLEELVSCSNSKLLEFIYSNLKYPESAIQRGVEGMVLVKLVINTSGKIDWYEIMKSDDDDLKAAVRPVMKKLTDETTWTPGKQNNQIVDSEFILPVKFKLE